ncbi:hypothetical protein F5884DRAFT_713644, partial [Xylogone sp. PMI_703]
MHIVFSYPLIVGVLSALPPVQAGQTFSCQPSQSCWPTTAQWQAFNQTLSGRLRTTVMLSSPCFEDSPNFNNATCASIQANYFNGTFRQQTFGSMEESEWEACGTANCYPPFLVPGATTCSLGRISEFYVDAETAEQVVTTLTFVRSHNIRLVLRNTGHDYLGRSASPNALTLRTSNMKNLEFHPTFTASNCSSANGQNIGVIGAGIQAQEATAFFLQHGMMVTTGGCPSVGMAGGFGQAAGHGPLAPTFGLMVDQAVEFDVITTDGQLRTINACNDPDLFWAMRGGGGQSYAILLNYKFQLHPSTGFATWHFQANLSASALVPNITQRTALRDVITAIGNNQTTWTKNHISGYDILNPGSVEFLQILPGNDALDNIKALTADLSNFLSNHPDLVVGANEYEFSADQQAFFDTPIVHSFIAKAGSSGGSVLIPSRLIPSQTFANASSVTQLATSILEGMELVASNLGPALASNVHFISEKTSPFNTPDAEHATSANRAWRDTLWHFVTASSYLPGTSASDASAIVAAARNALEPIKDILPVQAAYTNEADPGEPNWQEVFYGEDYDRLLQVKRQYDPDSLLNCWKCVGWLGPEDPMYSCYKQDP